MSGRRQQALGLFLRPAEGAPPARVAPRAAPLGTSRTLLVLCEAELLHAAAAMAALALARVLGAPCALAAVGGASRDPRRAGVATVGARRAAARLRAAGRPAAASGRLVWLSGPFGALAGAADPVGVAAGASLLLGRASAASGLPGVLALPHARTDALDRLIGWHDGVIAIPAADASCDLSEHVEASVAALGRRCVCISALSRRMAALAELGLHVPAAAVDALARLGDDA